MLLLSERDVQDLLPMDTAMERVTASFMAQHAGRGINRSRDRIFLPGVSLHYMAAGLPDENLVGMKIYSVTRSAWRFLVLLYSAESGELLAAIEADHLGRIRTGAASGVATRHMARADASRVGVIGTGRQARTQLKAVSLARKIGSARAFSRDAQRRETFAGEMSQELGFPVEPVETAEAAARFGQVVITATTSEAPSLMGAWLNPGTHVNAVGANMRNRRELDDEAVARAAVIAVDSREQAQEEAGDLIQGFGALQRRWDGVIELHEVVNGSRRGRASDDEITLFKSSGIALWDVAVAGQVYREALKHGRGRRVELWNE
jgi:ornithine cyclodeaminase/alanine dehydrogenase-like protein (mu-crystallin family)